MRRHQHTQLSLLVNYISFNKLISTIKNIELCPHCTAFKPLYEEAASTLENDPDGKYYFAEANTMDDPRLGEHFEIRAHPTLLGFSHSQDYLP